MNRRLIVTPEALEEVLEIYSYHKRIDQALADRFDKELDVCFNLITRNPTGYQIRRKNYRHIMLRKFKYRVVYALIGQNVVVFQIRHTSRKVSSEFGP